MYSIAHMCWHASFCITEVIHTIMLEAHDLAWFDIDDILSADDIAGACL